MLAVVGTSCLGLFKDPLFSVLRLSIARMEMKTMGENPKGVGVGVGKRENKCILSNFFLNNVCRQANAFQLCIVILLTFD